MTHHLSIPPSGLAVDPKTLGHLKAQAAKDPHGALKEAAREFETLFLDMMMKSMRTAAAGHSLFDSQATRVFTGLLDHEFSRQLSDRGGLGLADLLIKQLSKLAPAPPSNSTTVKKTLNLPITKA